MADRPGDPAAPAIPSAVAGWSPQVGGGPMYARSWRLALSAYPAPDAMELVVAVVLPRIASLPGFSGGSILVDRESGDVITTTYWDSVEHLEGSAAAAANAAAAGQILGEGATLASMHVCDVLAVVPTPAVADLGLLPPATPDRAAVEGPDGP
ncbi:MAG: hypothetical protein JWR20_720 [Marmoricola sp.]|nr:hypothetical protein [Marmoricola sp.]